jgi:hypothetical protein
MPGGVESWVAVHRCVRAASSTRNKRRSDTGFRPDELAILPATHRRRRCTEVITSTAPFVIELSLGSAL